MFITGMIVGVIIGANAGFLILALCVAAKKGDMQNDSTSNIDN